MRELLNQDDAVFMTLLKALQLNAGVERKFLSVKLEKKEGTITIPPTMSLKEAIQWLTIKDQADEKVVQVTEVVKGFPLDVVNSMSLTIDRRYGFKEARDHGWQPPSFFAVPIDSFGNTKQVFTGAFTLPGIEGKFTSEPVESEGLAITGTVKQRHLPEIHAFLNDIRQTLKTDSLYRGKAIKIDQDVQNMGMVMPEFMDTAAGRQDLLLNSDIAAQVRAAIWNVIIYQDKVKRYGVPSSRGILLEGPYGTGKTLCAVHTAPICEENKWTFLYCERPKDLIYAYKLAKQWMPAVVFVEDVDQIPESMFQQLTTTLDGVDNKNDRIVLIMTTNFVEKIPLALMRPGRIDTPIHFEPPDQDTIRQLVQFYSFDTRHNRSLLHDKMDWDKVLPLLVGNTPTIIREVVEFAKLAAIESDPLVLTTGDLVASARAKQRHIELTKPKERVKTSAEQLAEVLPKVVFGEGNELESSPEVNGKLDNLFAQVRNVLKDVRYIKPMVEATNANVGEMSEKVDETKDNVVDKITPAVTKIARAL